MFVGDAGGGNIDIQWKDIIFSSRRSMSTWEVVNTWDCISKRRGAFLTLKRKR